jgi:hypothetical protein
VEKCYVQTTRTLSDGNLCCFMYVFGTVLTNGTESIPDIVKIQITRTMQFFLPLNKSLLRGKI